MVVDFCGAGGGRGVNVEKKNRTTNFISWLSFFTKNSRNRENRVAMIMSKHCSTKVASQTMF